MIDFSQQVLISKLLIFETTIFACLRQLLYQSRFRVLQGKRVCVYVRVCAYTYIHIYLYVYINIYDEMRSTHIVEDSLLYTKSTDLNVNPKTTFMKTSRIVFKQISRHHGLTKLTYKVNHHICLPCHPPTQNTHTHTHTHT